MSEPSTPTTGTSSGLINHGRFAVWGLGTDSYVHTELSNNFNVIDGMIGAPANGSAWPASYGPGAGIWGEIEKLKRERAFLGQVTDLWMPWTSGTSVTTITTYLSTNLNPLGWYVADGSTVTSSVHQFAYAQGSSIQLPNLLNQYRIGADPSKSPGSTGSLNSQPSGAPGMTVGPTSSHGVNAAGSVGTNLNTVTVTIPDHAHNFNHSHTATAPAASASTGVDSDSGAYVTPTSTPGGSAVIAALQGHTHGVSVTVNAPGINEVYQNTGGMLSGAGSTYQLLDNRPYSMACIPIIKIAYVETPVANPYGYNGNPI